MTESVVYAIAAGWRVKIGYTTNLRQRMKEIQAMSPLPIVCLGTAPGGRALEAALHRQFAPHRVHGEWFELVQADRTELLARLGGKPYFIKLARAGKREMLPEFNRRKHSRRERYRYAKRR